jgi:hypothetical protein
VRYQLKTPYPVKRDERPGRHDAQHFRAARPSRPAGRAGAAAAGAPDEVSRGVRPAQPLACRDHPARAGNARAELAARTDAGPAHGCAAGRMGANISYSSARTCR